MPKFFYTIRTATIDDVDTIIEHRRNMVREIRHCEESTLDLMSEAFRKWLPSRIISGEYRGWLAIEKDNSVVAGLGLWILDDWFPSVLPSGGIVEERGYLLNVYTDPEHRMNGLSRLLVSTSLDWCRERGIKMVSLHASPFGRPLYESLGFVNTNEMRLVLE